jgi:hypothetical protein
MIDLSHLAPHTEALSPGFEGKWHAIEFQPDLTVPQRFVIGAALSCRGKISHFRVAAEAPKLKCFYAQRFSKEVWGWMRNELIAELRASTGATVAKFTSASPQITLGEGFYASASNADIALARVFERIVTVVANQKAPRVQGVAQADLRLRVSNLLKQAMSSRYESVSQPEGGLLIKDAGSVHTFDIGYDDNITAASVVSASYASLDTARLNVMTAMNDLYTFLKIRKREQIGIAVLTPSTDVLPGETVRVWQDWWQHTSYKLRESELVLLAEADTAESLADQVSDWYPEPASS